MAQLLVAGGVDVHVLTPAKNQAHSDLSLEPEVIDGVKLYRVPAPDLTSAAINFYQIIDRLDRLIHFDLFHGFYLPMAYPCLAVAERGGRPVIASIRGDDGLVLLEDDLYKDAVTAVLQKATWITSVSRDSIERASKLVDISQRSSFLPNSIDPGPFSRWSLTDHNRGITGTVCTFRRKKNIPLLIQAYSLIDPGLRRKLLLVGTFGDPTANADLDGAIDQYQIRPEIEITGYVENTLVPQYLCSMHVFVLSSTHEGLPNAILEAAAAGLPIVSTAVDGVKDVLRHAENALLVPPEDPGAMAAAIERVLNDDGLASRLSQEALRTAETFSLEREKQLWLELYRQLLT